MSIRNLIDVRASGRLRKAATEASGFRCRIRNAENGSVELLIFDFIGKDSWTGDGVSAEDVANFLAENRGTPVNVRINSPGGDAFDGITIFNALRQHNATVTTTIEGIAASAASVISLAGDPSRMFDNGSLFVHRAQMLAYGNRDSMEEVRDVLDKVDQQIATTMASKSSKTKGQCLALMVGKVDGTIMDASEALEWGLIDEIISTGRGRGAGNRRPSGPGPRSSRLQQIARDERSTRIRQIERDSQLCGAGN